MTTTNPINLHKHLWVVVTSRTPDANGRFPVEVSDGRTMFMEQWTLDRIKQAIADGDDVREAR